MRRTNVKEVRIDKPGKGVITRIPPDLPDKKLGQYWVVANNVRCEDATTRNAPGYERIVPGDAEQLDGAPNLIMQATLSGPARETSKQVVPVVGTEGNLYIMRRQSRPNPCHIDNVQPPPGMVDPPEPPEPPVDPPIEPPVTTPCRAKFAFISETFSQSPFTNTVNAMATVVSKEPDFVVHGGNSIDRSNLTGPLSQQPNLYDDHLFQFYFWACQGYRGAYGIGPTTQNLYAAIGQGEYEEPQGYEIEWEDLFIRNPSDDPRYYSIKRGPFEIFFIDTYGQSTISPGAGFGHDDLSDTGPQAVWLQAGLAASTAHWKVVVMSLPPWTSNAPTGSGSTTHGYSEIRWPFKSWGADFVLTGNSEYNSGASVIEAFGPEHITDEGTNSTGDFFLSGAGGMVFGNFSTSDVNDAWSADDINGHKPVTNWRLETRGAWIVDADETSCDLTFYNEAGEALYSHTFEKEESLTATCSIETEASEVVKLKLLPTAEHRQPYYSGIQQSWGNVQVEQRIPLRLLAISRDGNCIDATSLAFWSSDDTAVATVGGDGKVFGISPGSTVITGEYAGMTVNYSITVNPTCYDTGVDWVVAIEMSARTLAPCGFDERVVDKLRRDLDVFLDSIDDRNDRVCLITFSNVIHSVLPMTDDFNAARNFPLTPSVAYSCDLNAAGIEAIAQIDASIKADRKVHSVFVIDSRANTAPADTTRNNLYARGCVSVVMTSLLRGTPSTEIQFSSRNLAGSGVEYFNNDSHYHTSTVLAELKSLYCRSSCGNARLIDEEPCAGATPRLNYDDFTSWSVDGGEIDLVGKGSGTSPVTLYDIYDDGAQGVGGLDPVARGLYVDLAGSGPAFNGTITTPKSFLSGWTFTAGVPYRIKFALAGNWRQPVDNMQAQVLIQDFTSGVELFSNVYTVAGYKDLFAYHTIDITPVSTQSNVHFLISQLDGPVGRWSAYGLLFDDFSLVSDPFGTPSSIFADDFDTEEVCN